METRQSQAAALKLGQRLRARGLTLATAESCTGGLVGALLTAAPGSSDYYVGGVVAYANEAKIALLGVDATMLAQSGAVSADVAEQMAEGIRRRLGTSVAISITGIAGPGGGTPEKPVGLVYISLASAAGTVTLRRRFAGDRTAVRAAAAAAAMKWVAQTLQ